MFAFGLVLIVTAFLLLVVGLVATVRGAHRHFQNHRRSVQVSRRQTQATRAQLRTMTINAKHTKAHRAQHDQVERIQFAAIKARDIALDAAKVADTVAEHLAAMGREA